MERNTRTHKDHMEQTVNNLTSRHIAKLLVRLGDTIAPVVVQEIKREFRFLADDIKQEINTEISTHEERNEANGNR